MMLNLIAKVFKKEKNKKEKHSIEEQSNSKNESITYKNSSVTDQRIQLKNHFTGLFNFGFQTPLPKSCEIFFKDENKVYITNSSFSIYKTIDLNKDKNEVLDFLKKFVKDYSLENEVSFKLESKDAQVNLKIEKPIQFKVVDYQIFTDGSKFYNELDPSLSRVGGAYLVYDKYFRERRCGEFRLDNNCSVIEAELSAVYLAIHFLISINLRSQNIDFFIDCQEAIFLLNSKDFRSKFYRLSDCFAKMIEVLRKKNLSLYFKWVKGHSSITQNEKADRKAKQATKLPCVTFNKKIYIKI